MNVPAAPDLEEALLGAVLIDPALRDQLALDEADFHVHRHRFVWRAMATANGGLDILTVQDELERAGLLSEVGGPGFLIHLISGVPSTLHAAEYAERLRDLSRRRQLLHAANEIAKVAFDLDAPTDAAFHLLEEVQNRSAPAGGAVPIQSWVAQAYTEIEQRRAEPEGRFALATGFPDLDRFTGGLYPDEGTYFLLAGQPGIGKTILLKDICEHLALQAPGALYSLEMKRLRLMMRTFSARSGVEVRRMRSGRLDQAEIDRLTAALDEYRPLQMYVSDRTAWTTAALRADLYRLKTQHGLRWWALDYLSLVNDAAPGLSEHDRVREVSRRILQINRQLGLAAIVIHTLNKEGFEKHAGMSAFAGAAGVMYDADVSAYLSSTDLSAGDWTPVDLNFVKNRDGEDGLGSITLGRRSGRPQFVTPVARHREEPVAWWNQK